MAKTGKTVKRAFKGQELDNLTKQEGKLKQHMSKLIDMQLEFSTDMIAKKMKQVEAQLLFVQGQIEELKGQEDVGEELTWVDHYIKEAQDLIGFPFSYRGMNPEQQNLFLKRFIRHVIVLKGEITEVKFTEDVERLLQLVTNVTELNSEMGDEWNNQLKSIEQSC